MIASLDFETFFTAEYSLREMSTYKYVFDPRFDAYLVAIYSDDFQYYGHPSGMDWSKLEGATLIMHNAAFDGLVMKRLEQDGVIPKALRYELFDTADMVVYLRAARSLKDSVKQLLGVEMDKSTRDFMKGKDFATLSPEDKERVREYGLTDAKLTYELWKRFHDQWPACEQALSKLNRESQWHGVMLDTDAVERGVQALQTALFEAAKNIPWIDEGLPPLSPKAIRIQGRKDGIPVPASLAKTDEAAIAWELEYGEAHPWIKACKEWRSINTLLKKTQNLRDGAGPDGTFYFSKKYHGALTGRFSGGSDSGGKVNIENLPREPMYGVDVRPMFVSRPGRSLVISDYSQIEARMLLWRVGDQKMLDIVRSGVDLYEAHARVYLGYEGTEPLKSAGKKDKQLSRLRFLSKARCLGLGYGCGGAKFVTVAKNLANLILTPEEAKFQVDDFREKNPLIVGYWNRHDHWLKISAGHKDDEHVVPLVSGRNLRYFNPRFRRELGKGGISRTGTVAQQEIGGPAYYMWGGVLTENEIQAIARDILRDAWIALSDAGFDVLFSVHDELVIEVPDEGIEEKVKEIERIMTTSSPWAAGCPLAVETNVSKTYCK